MGSTFDDDFAAAALGDHLSFFGRSVTFRPAEGESRTIVAAISSLGREIEDRRQIVDEEVERLSVLVRRDDDHATQPGIERPQIRDAIEHPDEDPDVNRYTFTGETEHGDNPNFWVLIFARSRVAAYDPR